jgi:dihydrofolate reductase
VLGRRTYEGFASHWPNASTEEQPVADPLNKGPKYVATRTLSDPLEWHNSTVLNGDLSKSINALKGKDGDDLHVIGSTSLVRSLLDRDLVDEVRVIIDPLVVGGGKRVFTDDGRLRPMRLLDSKTTSKGSIIASYALDRS